MINSQALSAYLTDWAERKHLTGVSACMLGPDGQRFDFAHGWRDAALSKPVDGNTMYGIASMSKSITALCACILACEGKLRLDDPVSDYVPGFRVPGQPRESVTVRHLAMHTAGIPPMEPLEWSIAMNSPARRPSEWLTRMRETAPNAMATLEQVTDYIATCGYATLGAPGEVMSYSNEGYAVLSAVVDAAAGEPLERYMHTHVFAPLGMTRSVLDNGIEEARRLAAGNLTSLFEHEDGERVCDDAWSVLPPFRGCAMVKSTARDMAVYYRALANMGLHEGRQVIPRQAVDWLIGRYHPLSEQAVMCMGLNKRAWAGHTVCEHSGALHGVSSKGALLLGEGWGFAALSNEGEADLDELVWGMLNAVAGLPLDTDHAWFRPNGRTFSMPEALCGLYIGHEGVPSILHVTQDAAGALGCTRDDESYTLSYCGGTRFWAMKAGSGERAFRLEFLIRDGKAWGVRCGTRVFGRM